MAVAGIRLRCSAFGRLTACGLLSWALLGSAERASAQVFTVLNSFEGGPGPSSLIQGLDGNSWGTTSQGGTNDRGSVFKVAPDGTLTTVYSFTGTDGAYPGALVQASDRNFYGATSGGGAFGSGAIFRVSAAGVLTTLYSFSGADGSSPNGTLFLAADGNLYGTTQGGGANGLGTFFAITPGGALTSLHSIAPGEGLYPQGPLTQGSDGSLYGTASAGGTSGLGVVFKVTTAGSWTTLYSFAGTDGSGPAGGVAAGSDGNFYGVASAGGANGGGTVFRITPSGVLTTLYSFAGSDGLTPSGGVTLAADGNFYGTTYVGGASYGTVFRITPSGVLTTLAVFNPGTGFWPRSNLVQESDGNFYGTTSNGGGFGKGTVFAIKTDGTLTTVASFPGPVQGAGADSGIVQAADGSFYGETYLGGVYGLGTVYRLTPAGVLTILHSFAGGSEGALGFNALVQGSDGNFYGSTEAGGTSNKGTIFTMTPAGGFTTLYTFTGPDGATPQSALVQGADGNFYGTTIGGGANGKGTAFVITPAGILTTLHSFNGPGDGRSPYAPLLLASDGNFYGATRGGGSGAKGTLFRMTPAGALTTLYAFAGADGQNPVQALVQAADGNLYGTTYVGGLSGLGTVFRITPSGTLATLYSFSGSDGRNPIAGLSIGSDGNFYGTTEFGGTADLGTIFRITPTGTLTTLFSFSTPVGTDPFGGVIQGRDGNFYGTANWGGPLNGGVVYRLVLGAGPAPAITGVSPANGPMAGGTALTISGSDFQPGVTVTIGGIPATNVTFISATTIRAFTPASASSGAVAVAVLNPDGQSRTLPSAFTYGCVSAPVAVASGDATICAGGAAGGTVLVGSGGASCSWSPATDLSNPNDCRPAATPAATTTYTLTVTDVNGCVSANAPTVTVTVAPCANLSIAASAPSSVIAGNQVAVTVTVTNVVPKTGAADAVGVTVGSAAPPAGFTFVSNTGDCTTGFPCALGTLPVGATRTIVTTFATTNPFPAPPGPAYVSALFNVSSTTMDPYALDNSTQAWIFVLPAGSPLTGIWPLPLGACQSYGALEPAPGGTLYGTTFAGGGYGAGTTFSFDPTSGSVNALGSFSGAEGANPQIGLTRASDGKFYGTAPVGLRGGATFGAVYRFDPAGKTPLVALYAFNGSDGWSPIGRLIQAADGLLYGTTYRGGTTDQGTIFRVDPATGTFTPLFSFSGANGRNPQAGLIQASDGFFYGTTYFGGSSDQGTVYRFDSASGTVTPLVQFTGANGRQPFIGGLMQASDGNLYGTTLYGGTNDNGTIFRVALPAGALTTIHSFNDTDGREPHAALIQAADGLLYGAAEIGTPTGGGAIFRIHPVSLTYQVLYQFAGLEGKFPRGALIWSADGSLYGTTSYGGTNNCGSVYQLVPPPLPVVATATVSGGGTICAGGSATIQAALTGAAPFSVTWSDDVTQSGVMTSTVTRTVSPVATTAYTVTSMSDASGPGGSTGAATVSVNPLPAASPIPGATLGKPYSTVLAATAGSPPYTFSVSGALPAGLTFTGATATITGTPTASGAFPLAILVADAKGCSSSTPQTLVVCAPITVSPATLSAGSTGVATSRTLTAAGGTAPYAFAITSGALPAGLTLSPAGVITGNALQTGTFTFTVTATDANGCTGSRAYTWTLNCPALSLNPTTFAGVTIGDPLARTLTTTNAAGAVAYAVTSGALPAGLTLTGNQIAGTPSVNGTYTFTITATDAAGCSASRAYTWTVSCPALTLNPASFADVPAGAILSRTLSLGGGPVLPVTYTVTSGALPPGLAIASNLITGTPTATGAFSFTIGATDAVGCTTSKTYTWNVICPAITVNPATEAAATVGVALNRALATAGGVAPVSLTLTGAPAWLTLSGKNLVGTPPAAGSVTFTVTATDANNCTGSRNYTLAVNCPAITVTTTTLARGLRGSAYSKALAVSGGKSPWTFAVTAGTLPSGLTLSASGLLSGTLAEGGSFPFTVVATDANGCSSAARALTLDVDWLVVNNLSLGTATGGTSYSRTFTQSGGPTPVAFTIAAGAFPAGLSLAPSGFLSGTPTQAGTFPFTVEATDSGGHAATRAFSLTVGCFTFSPADGPLAGATLGKSYSQALTLNGGVGPVLFQTTAGSLPPGISISANKLVGTPTASGTYSFTLTATDGAGCTVSRNYSIVVGCMTIAQTAVAGAIAGKAYSQAFTVTGGLAPVTLSLAGALPPGLAWTAPNRITGTPTEAPSASPITVTATDAGGCSTSRPYTLTVGCFTFTPGAGTLAADATAGVPYALPLVAAGGVGAPVFAVTSGALPPGLSLSGNQIVGTPDPAGVSAIPYTFTITGTDGAGCTPSRTYALTVNCASLVPATLPAASLGAPYSQTLTIVGGTSPALSLSGALPSGMSFDPATGNLAGIPGQTGTFALTFTVTDGSGCTHSETYSFVVSCTSIAILPVATTIVAASGTPFTTLTFTTTGGIPPVAIDIEGDLPNGMAAAGPTLSGTPTETGLFPIVIRAVDVSGCQQTKSYVIQVN